LNSTFIPGATPTSSVISKMSASSYHVSCTESVAVPFNARKLEATHHGGSVVVVEVLVDEAVDEVVEEVVPAVSKYN